MSGKRHFPKEIVAAIRDGKILGIRAGTKPHRVIGIWAVVVEGRVFVRSYSLKQRSWYRTFLEEPRGIIEVDGKQIPVRPTCAQFESRLGRGEESGDAAVLALCLAPQGGA